MGARQLGRFVGFAYFLPWLWFVARGVVRGRLAVWLACVGALGGFQGAIGWVMVASGLKEGMIAVSPDQARALHLTTACVILTCLVCDSAGAATGFGSPRCVAGRGAPRARHRRAGARADRARRHRRRLEVRSDVQHLALMDGALVPPPSALFAATPWFANFVENSTLIQFNHRLTAYLLLGVAVWHWLAMRRAGEPRGRRCIASRDPRSGGSREWRRSCSWCAFGRPCCISCLPRCCSCRR